MSDLTIDFEWLDPSAAKGAELRATWARLAISLDGYPLTRVYDERSKTIRDAVYLPLYPLAEWLAEQWWPLWNEPVPSSSADRSGYETRHSLLHSREEYALPPLRIEPTGLLVHVSWLPERLPSHRLEFTGHGEVWIETKTLKDQMSALVDAVVGRLDANGITDSFLQQEWQAIRMADADERIFCECTGALGLDPYSLDENQQREIEDAGDLLPAETVAEFFRAARTRRGELKVDAEEVHAAVARATRNTTDLAALRQLHRTTTTWSERSEPFPWEQGYSLAQRFRAHLGLDGRPLKSMEGIGAAIGTSVAELNTALSRFSSRTMPFAALVGINNKLSPVFILRPALQASERFHFCRALFEYLYSPIPRSVLITDANTEEQKRNRAFAAELLAPASALRARIGAQIVTWEQTEEIADEFGVSAYVIAHQLSNHRIATVQQS